MGKQVGIMVDVADRQVIVRFDRELDYIQLTPRQALELAETIANKVVEIGNESPIVLVS